MTLPNALYDGAVRTISNPIIEIDADIATMRLRDIFLSSVVMNLETNTELKKMATNKDDPKTTDNVIGK